MPMCMQSYHSQFCISSPIYTLANLCTKQLAEARRYMHVYPIAGVNSRSPTRVSQKNQHHVCNFIVNSMLTPKPLCI